MDLVCDLSKFLSRVRVGSAVFGASWLLLVCLAVASDAAVVSSTPWASPAVPARLPAAEAVTLSTRGGLWFDGAAVRRIGDRRIVGHVPAATAHFPYVAESAKHGFALLAGSELLSGSVAGRPAPLPTARSGCWTSGIPSEGAFFTVTGSQLVTGSAWSCSKRRPVGPQPIFERPLRGGRWRVLTRVPGTVPPILAGDSTRLAIGVQQSRSRMQVLLVDPGTGHVRRSVRLPDGYLALDGPARLVVSVPLTRSFPLGPRFDVGQATVSFGAGSSGSAYAVAEFSSHGGVIRRLGTTATQPLVSGGRMIVSTIGDDGSQTLILRALRSGASRRLVGFRDPGRVLLATAFAWPRLAIVQTTSAALPDGQFTCAYGTYMPPSDPTLALLDVTHLTFQPAPRLPPQPTPQERAARCGPPPP